ncbi:hypothetical protein ICJ54_24965 [Pseudomonas asiatica]|uniref:hypothetical protein n=1 Tax=Pseudomonas TaxID=286 RepID=UPI0015714E0C|nr:MULTISPECIES: hypothetical protein [Pseudomonas]MDD2077024.1 hypothetical protein [Pseudomonas putida]QKL04064.1 hypothetical protein GEV39_23045 [Pseudomonas sp. NY5710]QNT40644.1 hypothetical protein ICJ54_24965 [Pseudomonas asiatica]HDS1693554.1 hypothetical protein [Pseudomonas putida]
MTSPVRVERAKLAVSLALAYKDFEVYRDVRAGEHYFDIKAEKLVGDKYDTFYVLIEVVPNTPRFSIKLASETRRLSEVVKRPVYFVRIKDNAAEVMLDPRLQKRVLFPATTRLLDMPDFGPSL